VWFLGLAVPKTNARSLFPSVKWTNTRTPVPHNKLIREKQTPTQQHWKLEMYCVCVCVCVFVCVCGLRRRTILYFSLQHLYTNTTARNVYVSSLMAVPVYRSRCSRLGGSLHALTAVVAPSGSSWCLMTATVPGRLHIGHGAPCECLVFILTFSATEQGFGLGWRGWGKSHGADTGLDDRDRLVTSALWRHLPRLVTMAFISPTV